jgi:hypothetical protein
MSIWKPKPSIALRNSCVSYLCYPLTGEIQLPGPPFAYAAGGSTQARVVPCAAGVSKRNTCSHPRGPTQPTGFAGTCVGWGRRRVASGRTAACTHGAGGSRGPGGGGAPTTRPLVLFPYRANAFPLIISGRKRTKPPARRAGHEEVRCTAALRIEACRPRRRAVRRHRPPPPDSTPRAPAPSHPITTRSSPPPLCAPNVAASPHNHKPAAARSALPRKRTPFIKCAC